MFAYTYLYTNLGACINHIYLVKELILMINKLHPPPLMVSLFWQDTKAPPYFVHSYIIDLDCMDFAEVMHFAPWLN